MCLENVCSIHIVCVQHNEAIELSNVESVTKSYEKLVTVAKVHFGVWATNMKPVKYTSLYYYIVIQL